MKILLLRKAIAMAKYVLYGTVALCVFLNVLVAKDSNAQRKKLDEVFVSIHVEKGTLQEVFAKISNTTNFRFSYNDGQVDVKKLVTIQAENSSLAHVLGDLSRMENLIFKRINDNIHVSLIAEEPPDNKPMVVDILAIDLSGKVISADDNEGLPGVNVLIKGTSQGTITDIDGNFRISVEIGDTLAFSSVGYLTEEIPIENNQSYLTITLVPDITQLEEMVVVGYGTQSKRNLTSAVSSIDGNDIKEMPVAGIDQALQGRAAGVMVTNNTGEPGGGVTIRVRGTTSIGSGNDPLYVIDGVPVNNTQTANVNVGESRMNEMSQLNPADIASIEILKDAASASIYGARASNGVVLITTKRGIKGQNQLSLDMYTGFSNPTNQYDLLGASDFATLVNEGRAQLADEEPGLSPIFDENFIANPTTDTDWQDEIFQTGVVSSINLAARGGSESTQYMVSGGYFSQEGIIIGSDFQRYSMRANVDQKINSKIKLGANLYASYIDQRRLKNDGSPTNADAGNNNHIYGGPVLSSALVKSPAAKVYEDNGSFAVDTLAPVYSNPVRQAIGVDIEGRVTRVTASLFAEWDIVQGLNFRTQFAGDLRGEYEDWFNPPNPNSIDGLTGEGRASRRTFDQVLYTIDNYFTYDFSIGESHNFTALIGTSFQQTNWESSFLGVSNIESDKITTLNAGVDIDIATSTAEGWGIASYFSRLNYNYDGKYLLLLNARYDGSSRFGKENRYGFFPSGSVGWRISQEGFMDGVTFINDLKLRGSYGLTGNQEIDNYAGRGIFGLGTGTNSGNNYGGSTGATITSLPSPDLQWEETAQLDIGVDLSILNSRINITADYYVKQTDNLLFNIPLPSTTGFNTKLANIGKMENKGFEFAINSVNIQGNDFTWSSNFNISTLENKVVSLLDGEDIIVGSQFNGFSIAREDEEISFYLYEREEFVDPETGLTVLIDQDGDGGLADEGDLVLAGSPFPDFFGGFTNNLNYKNFDLSLFFQYSYGNKIFNLTRKFMEELRLQDRSIIGANTTQESFDKRWQQVGDVTEYPKVNYDDANNQHNTPHTGWLEDGSYLRLKTLSLGYTFGSKVLEKLRMTNARVYFSSNNLLTFTKYSGFDPEVDHFTGVNGATTNSGLRRGYDYGSYPQSRTFVWGVNITF